jgi:hypothetical protein
VEAYDFFDEVSTRVLHLLALDDLSLESDDESLLIWLVFTFKETEHLRPVELFKLLEWKGCF